MIGDEPAEASTGVSAPSSLAFEVLRGATMDLLAEKLEGDGPLSKSCADGVLGSPKGSTAGGIFLISKGAIGLKFVCMIVLRRESSSSSASEVSDSGDAFGILMLDREGLVLEDETSLTACVG